MEKYIVAVGLAGIAVTSPVTAQNIWGLNTDSVTVKTSLGLIAGESKEYVYNPDTGYKSSELDWKIKNTPVIKGDISWDVLKHLTLNARGWTTLASRGALMDDYDWNDATQPGWTDWSTHSDTRLNYANEYDINLKGWVFNEPRYRFGGVAGYQQTRFSWMSFGGYYQYDNGTNVGYFPRNARAIGYQQRFSVPYLGLAGMYRYRNFEFNMLLKFSPWVRAKGNDEHYMRELTFRDNAVNSKYYSATVDAGYYITPAAKVFTEFSISKFSQGKGGTQIIDNDAGENEYIGGDAAGIANINYGVSVGVQYRF
ncbi:omptin family outer membrane protease [Brenneria rubrifaciens]|uniref:Omptin family outer membrane protease n=1 Tax=Brenneria rubrifaciens TaxID=55213 RepID=A0A4V1F9S4_9GAMM|nr:omptin family outer membrane protease [Brenneria rubrifaciens]QCR08583.1 omptin family outer membrane protease [Brenneria rubrifaciens]